MCIVGQVAVQKDIKTENSNNSKKKSNKVVESNQTFSLFVVLCIIKEIWVLCFSLSLINRRHERLFVLRHWDKSLSVLLTKLELSFCWGPVNTLNSKMKIKIIFFCHARQFDSTGNSSRNKTFIMYSIPEKSISAVGSTLLKGSHREIHFQSEWFALSFCTSAHTEPWPLRFNVKGVWCCILQEMQHQRHTHTFPPCWVLVLGPSVVHVTVFWLLWIPNLLLGWPCSVGPSVPPHSLTHTHTHTCTLARPHIAYTHASCLLHGPC